MEPDICEILTEAQALIKDKMHWTTEAKARDASGRSTYVTSSMAAMFCALGAIERVERDGFKRNQAIGFINRVAIEMHPMKGHPGHGYSITGVNDHLGHKRVMAVFKEAIRRCQAEQ